MDNGGGIGNVNIYLNGSQVTNDTRGVIVKGKESTTEKSLSFTISLLDGGERDQGCDYEPGRFNGVEPRCHHGHIKKQSWPSRTSMPWS